MTIPRPDEGELLERFVQAVERSPHNLVSRRARGELRSRHLPECRELARMLPPGPARLLDVGSGGGFPGLVIAVCRPDLQVSLLDSTAKKARFLAETAADLGLDVEVHNGRAEELAGELGPVFDLVTARAVAPMERLIPWTVPFLRPDGLLYAVKGESWAEELDAATEVLHRNRARLIATPDDLHAERGETNDPAPVRVVIIGATP